MEKFPDLVDNHSTTSHVARGTSPVRANGIAGPNGLDAPRDRWLPRRDSRTVRWNKSGMPPQGSPPSHGRAGHARGHSRQKSLSEAFKTIRSRRGSVTQNAQEIADALRAPVSPTLIVCSIFSLSLFFFFFPSFPCRVQLAMQRVINCHASYSDTRSSASCGTPPLPSPTHHPSPY